MDGPQLHKVMQQDCLLRNYVNPTKLVVGSVFYFDQ